MINKTKNILGVILFALGIFFNPLFLEKVSSPQAFIGFKYKLPIEAISISLILIGVILLVIKLDPKSIKKLAEFYKMTAITLLSTLILFTLSNLICLTWYGIKDLMFYKNFIAAKYKTPLENLYPGFTKKEINQILDESWMRPYVYEPYTQFKERAFNGKYVNVHKSGFRHVKEQGPWPPDKNNFNIFVFGGSTFFNYGLPDYQTIPSYLQEFFNQKEKDSHLPPPTSHLCIYNFCQGYYFSSQECILLKKLITSGFIPNAALFIDGLNEFYQVNDEPFFTERLRNYFKGKQGFVLNIPIVRLISESKTRKANDVIDINNYKFNPLEIDTIINRYFVNKKITESICKDFNIKSYFIWQPIPTYKYDLNYHPFADGGFGKHSLSRYGYQEMEKYFKAGILGNNFLWLADMQEGIDKSLYLDKYHYTAEMSKEIAEKIYKWLKDKF